MKTAEFLPWHRETAAAWLGNRDRFAHAWLVHGLAGTGLREFVFAAAASLLCESPVAGLACGKCLACGWVASGNHPDLRRVRPELVALEEGAEQESEGGEAQDTASGPADSGGSGKRAPSREIRVEQIRALEPWFNNATHRGGWRVALVYPSEALNAISGNALLKVLEEPPPSTVFLMVADAPDRLLPTLLSRCRRLPLPTPSHEAARAWLKGQGLASPDDWLAAAGGAPVLAAKLAASQGSACPDWLGGMLRAVGKGALPDIGSLADTISKQPAIDWIDPMHRWCVDLMLARHGVAVRYYPALAGQTESIAQRADPGALAELAQYVQQQRRVAGHPLSAKLFAHALLQRVVSACQPARSAQTASR